MLMPSSWQRGSGRPWRHSMQTVHHSQTCLHVHMDTMHVENIDVQVQLQAHSLTHMHRCNQSSKNVVEARPARKMHVWLEYADTQWMPGSCRLKHHMRVRARNSPPMLLVMTTLPCLLRFSRGYAARTVWKTPSTFVAKMLRQLSSLVSWGCCTTEGKEGAANSQPSGEQTPVLRL
jgi:hypothetical protein